MESSKTRTRACLASALLACSILGGCAMSTDNGLPTTHVDSDGQVAVDHDRCGACHIGAHRGIEGYEAYQYPGFESLTDSDLVAPDPPPEAQVTESMMFENAFVGEPGEGGQES